MADSKDNKVDVPVAEFPVHSCDRKGCPKNDINAKLKRCARCQMVWYCSVECQKEQWKIHRTTLCAPAARESKERLAEQASQVESIRKHIAMIRNTPDLVLDMWTDAHKYFRKTFHEDQKWHRGAMCIDLADPYHPDADIGTTGRRPGRHTTSNSDPAEVPSMDVRREGFHYKYTDALDKVWLDAPDQYKTVIALMNTYDPRSEFVICVFFSSPLSGRMMWVAERIAVSDKV